MRGDLHTLKKICRYASTVMFVGRLVFAAFILLTLMLGVVSLFDAGAKDMLLFWLKTSFGVDSQDMLWPTYLCTVIFAVLGYVTVDAIYVLMESIEKGNSPFIDDNAKRLKLVSKAYLVATVPFAVLIYASQGNIPFSIYLCLGFIMVSVVMYCLAIVFHYGVELQTLSDETL